MKLDNRLNAMTVDVEDYFQVSAFEGVIQKKDWDSISLRVGDNTNRLLDLFAKNNVKSTFFTLGWVAQRCPEVIKRIVNEGHELASHGLAHQRATTMSEDQFREDVRQSKDILENIGGVELKGYRAPSFSINDSNTWAYDILKELGFSYSSSTYPINHDLYGVPEWPRFKYKRDNGLIEIPIPTIRKKETNIGIGGGGYFRLYPYWLSKRRISEFMKTENAPYSFYFHPWEIDAQQPKFENAPWKSKARHYINLSKMEGKVEKLLNDFNWVTMREAYDIK
ncbi:XrtA system polysaccharide deacetylase [Alteromonas sp.]|uniref:XrtA system polysaccharide deacetylase n=1 Tax=Alteromonas sp. TaxID=232 RepID=UPI000B62853C|nr:XrtA system polysaccharide deacetylase [Alteromonas sp.]MAI37332.1 polysaccharide deacetylase [Alteromonas sp.]OUX88916.1 MAG: polysaccharide deacetylase [Alteromonas sp. TMED35]|tara:strand:- start:33551 stop:34390 length:840 start_codon:yes stop_codon:yes gene_type:complete